MFDSPLRPRRSPAELRSPTAAPAQAIAAKRRAFFSTQRRRPVSEVRRRAAPPVSPRRRSAEGRRDDGLRRLEAALFLAREPLSSRKLAQHAQLEDGTEARALVRDLNRLYEQEGRAFSVESVAGGFRLMTRPRFMPWLRRLDAASGPDRISSPMLETLAVIAYRQPVPRAEVEAIRGVNCGEILRQLLDRNLVRIEGRSQELGRPYLYSTTSRFLETFGLRKIEDLPVVGRSEKVLETSGNEAPTRSRASADE